MDCKAANSLKTAVVYTAWTNFSSTSCLLSTTALAALNKLVKWFILTCKIWLFQQQDSRTQNCHPIQLVVDRSDAFFEASLFLWLLEPDHPQGTSACSVGPATTRGLVNCSQACTCLGRDHSSTENANGLPSLCLLQTLRLIYMGTNLAQHGEQFSYILELHVGSLSGWRCRGYTDTNNQVGQLCINMHNTRCTISAAGAMHLFPHTYQTHLCQGCPYSHHDSIDLLRLPSHSSTLLQKDKWLLIICSVPVKMSPQQSQRMEKREWGFFNFY